jgi:hypothetical protein
MEATRSTEAPALHHNPEDGLLVAYSIEIVAMEISDINLTKVLFYYSKHKCVISAMR